MTETRWVKALFSQEAKILSGGFGYPVRYLPPPGWDTGMMHLKEHLFYFVVSGICFGEVSGHRLRLDSGDLCWVSPGEHFRFYSLLSGSSPVLLRFRLSVCARNVTLRLQWPFRIFRNAVESLDWARPLALESAEAGRYSSQRVGCLAALFSMSLFENRGAPATPHGLPPAVCRRITRHVQEHPGERFQTSGLARLAGYSPDYFSRLFRKSFGMSPRTWLLQHRLNAAADLLSEPGWRISDVASRLGYADVFLFSRQFKVRFGASPGKWRKSREG